MIASIGTIEQATARTIEQATTIVRAARWEWFKLARRWMPWILLVILLLMSQLTVWGSYFTYQSLRRTGGEIATAPAQRGRPIGVSCSDILSGNTSSLPPGTSPQVVQGLQAECQQSAGRIQLQLAEEYNSFSLPGSVPTALNLGTSVGLILLAILAASHVGTEYGWGTLRPVLVRGIGRWQFLVAKVVILALVAGAAMAVVVLATSLSSTIADSLVARPIQAVFGATWAHAATVFLKSWVALIAYLVFVVFVTVALRSSAAGIAIGIIYYIGEQIVAAILSGLFGWFATVAKYLLGQNLATWAGLSLVGQSQSSSSDSLHAFLVLLAYSVVLGGVTLYLFHERDVAGASGG